MHFMGSVLSADLESGGARAETVDSEPTATQSSALSANISLERARLCKPEIAPKPVITRQPSVLAPYTQIWTDKGSVRMTSYFHTMGPIGGRTGTALCRPTSSPVAT